MFLAHECVCCDRDKCRDEMAFERRVCLQASIRWRTVTASLTASHDSTLFLDTRNLCCIKKVVVTWIVVILFTDVGSKTLYHAYKWSIDQRNTQFRANMCRNHAFVYQVTLWVTQRLYPQTRRVNSSPFSLFRCCFARRFARSPVGVQTRVLGGRWKIQRYPSRPTTTITLEPTKYVSFGGLQTELCGSTVVPQILTRPITSALTT